MDMIELKGYSYPFATLAQVIAAEAHWGRVVSVAIEHAGVWAVSEDCLERQGNDRGGEGRDCLKVE